MEVINPTNNIEQPLRAIIFDMDGVTFNTMEHTYHWQKSVYKLLGDQKKEFGAYDDEWMLRYNDLYEQLGLKGIYESVAHTNWEEHHEHIWLLYNEYHEENPLETIKLAGTDIADVINELYVRGQANGRRMTRLRLGINTTKSYRSLAPSLEAADIEHCFDTIVTYDDILRVLTDGEAKKYAVPTHDIQTLRKLVPSSLKNFLEKPNSLSAAITLEALGVTAKEVLVLEDTTNGIHAYKPVLTPPKPTTAYVVGVTWGYVQDRNKLIQAGADAIITRPEEIIPLAETLGAIN